MAPPERALARMQSFKVHKLLGQGSYGKVFKVQRDDDDKFYALKETELGSASQMERMDAVNEVRLLVSMNHPSVIRYHEAFLHGSKLCVVMEYAPYGDLKFYISKGERLCAPFPEEAVWRIFLQLCKGLSALHANKIVHRDIKPANIFLCQNDEVKIGDLGVAKALTRLDFARTQIGTPVFMAPEVWSGKLYSYSSDLWSLGCVLYEMMTFRLPIEARSMQELKVKVSSGRYTPIPAGRYSAELTAFCHGLLTVDPKRRPTPDTILGSAAAAKWLHVVPMPPPVHRRWSESGAVGAAACLRSPSGKQLIKTIIVPRDIRQLPKLLPPPSYEPMPRDLAPSPKDLAPSPKDLAPSPKDLAPSPRDLAPSPKDLAPVRNQLKPPLPPPQADKPAAANAAARVGLRAAGPPLPPRGAAYPGLLLPANVGLPQLPPGGLAQRQGAAEQLPAQRLGAAEQLRPGMRPGFRRVSWC